jgi:23S rRNA (uracil1939-C5)-methyltransferase
MSGIMEVEIQDVGYGGVGVARTEEGVIFVPGAFTGERVEIEITRKKKRFSQARLLKVITPSPHRCEAEEGVVPGMVYATLSYEAEVALKQSQLQTLFQRIGRLEGVNFLPPVASPKALHYRNKLTLHWDGKRLGYIGDDNKTVINTSACPLTCDPINAFLRQLRADKLALRRVKKGEKVILRYTPQDGVVVGLGRSPQGTLTECVAGLTLSVAADAFFQVNLACATLLLEAFREGVKGCQRVFDLYCGTGLFGFVAAQAGAKEVFGLETSPSAVASAKANARQLGIKGEYRCAPSECLPHNLPEADLWIVDPPRDGLSDEVRKNIFDYLPPRIAYISCGPDTLARDLAQLSERYQIDSVQLFDFFPRTAHFETLTFLTLRAEP